MELRAVSERLSVRSRPPRACCWNARRPAFSLPARPRHGLHAAALPRDDASGGGGDGGGGNSMRPVPQGGGGGWHGPAAAAFWLLRAVACYVCALVCGGAALDAYFAWTLPKLDTSAAQLSIIVPALNEEAGIADTVRALLKLGAKEVIVVDGGSSDKTCKLAEAAGATKVIRLGARGRGRQMNAGAEAASGDLLAFVHADTVPPSDLLELLKREFADPRTVVAGFVPSIEVPGRRLWGLSAHNFLKTWYAPIVMRPWSYVRGLRLLFGDQVICCRRQDFAAVGGYKAHLPIMEDAELCVGLHMTGPAGSAARADGGKPPYTGRGRVRQVLDGVAVTSGRRLAAWGSLRATYIHLVISTSWYFHMDDPEMPQRLHELYRKMYTDAFR